VELADTTPVVLVTPTDVDGAPAWSPQAPASRHTIVRKTVLRIPTRLPPAAVGSASPGRSRRVVDHRSVANERFSAVQSELESMSRWLFDHPELSYEEHGASKRLSSFLDDAGFTVEHPAYDLPTAFEATRGSSGPRVVICAEYDALPGVGHACGHNIIAAAALGAGAALAPVADALGIRVTVLGTPAEEKFGGKVDLIRAGAFDDCAAAMMIHPSTRDVVDPICIAIAELDVTFHGKTAHASAYPQLGINALDAFVQAYVNISTFRQHLYPTDKIHGIITDGGEAPNIIPDRTSSSWYVRAETERRLDELLGRVYAGRLSCHVPAVRSE
jgi:amidohydrolase